MGNFSPFIFRECHRPTSENPSGFGLGKIEAFTDCLDFFGRKQSIYFVTESPEGVVIGPGFGRTEETLAATLAILTALVEFENSILVGELNPPRFFAESSAAIGT